MDNLSNLPNLTKAPTETYENWINRRRMCAGLEYEPYEDPYPVNMGDYLHYPKFSVNKIKLKILEEQLKRLKPQKLTWNQHIRNGTINGTWKEKYQAYIQSPEWKQIRSRKITNSGSICDVCKKFMSSLQVHHLHYRTVGEERDEDLLVTCKACHPQLDEERKKRMSTQAENNAFATFCLKKYGAVLDSPSAYNEFYQWQENKERGYGNNCYSEDNYGDF